MDATLILIKIRQKRRTNFAAIDLHDRITDQANKKNKKVS